MYISSNLYKRIQHLLTSDTNLYPVLHQAENLYFQYQLDDNEEKFQHAFKKLLRDNRLLLGPYCADGGAIFKIKHDLHVLSQLDQNHQLKLIKKYREKWEKNEESNIL